MRILFLLCAVALHVTSSHAQSNMIEQGMRNLTGGIDSLSSKLSQAVTATHSGNLVFSPISASLIVLMAAYGAQNPTLEMFNSAANVTIRNPYVSHATLAYIASFSYLKQVELHLANKIFISNQLRPKKKFIQETAKVFRSQAQSLNFGNPTKASQIINDWCAKNTNKRIKDLVTSDDISDSNRLILLSAVYFNGKWKVPFDAAMTESHPFYSSVQLQNKNVKTMVSSEAFKYGELESINAQWIELPYKGDAKTGEISMFIILPKKFNDLPAVEKNLHKLTVPQLVKGKSSGTAKISLPKFKIESSINLEAPFVKIGLGKIFTSNANFGDITNEPLEVSKVSQKAFIEIDETGTEAAAVSTIQLDNKFGGNDKFIAVNHPFLYQIILRSTGTILFHGRVADVGGSVEPEDDAIYFPDR